MRTSIFKADRSSRLIPLCGAFAAYLTVAGCASLPTTITAIETDTANVIAEFQAIAQKACSVVPTVDSSLNLLQQEYGDVITGLSLAALETAANQICNAVAPQVAARRFSRHFSTRFGAIVTPAKSVTVDGVQVNFL
jgi:hypothetical protein